MGVFVGLDCIVIRGSIAKFLNGQNVSTLVCPLFGYPPRFTRHEYAKNSGVETITYSTQTGSYEFSGYDKIQEVQSKKKQELPAPFEGKNILRLEYKITRRRGIQAKFKRDLTVYDLFDIPVYRKIQNLFLEAYRAIPKHGNQCYLQTIEKVTPKTFTELLAEQYRQTFPKDYLHLLKTLRESGALSIKNYERIRAANREWERKYTLINKSPLITELDRKVIISVKDNSVFPFQYPIALIKMNNKVGFGMLG